MAAAALRESLRRLCADVGWSYAVFWKATRAADSQLQLVWGDGHCERTARAPVISGFDAMDLLLKEKAAALRSGGRGEGHAAEGAVVHGHDKVDALVNKLMVHQVHALGEGVIGHAALTGVHRWILHDSVDECGGANEVLPEMKQQLCAGIQTIAVIPVLPQGVIQLGSTKMVMEEAALINHVRSLFGQMGSAAGVLPVPHGAFVENPILDTSINNSLGVPASLSHPGDIHGCLNAAALNGYRINHHFRLQLSSSSTIQPLCHPEPQFYAGATSLGGSVTLASHCDLFQPLVQPDLGPNLLLNNQLKGDKSEVQLKNNGPQIESPNAFLHASSSLKESNTTVSSRRKCLSTEQHGSCLQGGMEITKPYSASSSCIGESQILDKVEPLTSQDCSVDCQISSATSMNRKFQTMSIADNSKREDDSFAISHVPFIETGQYSSCFQSLLGTLQNGGSGNSNAFCGDSSHNAVSGENGFRSSETRNSTSDNDFPELLKLPVSLQLTGANDLFDVLHLQQRPRGLNSSEVNNIELSSGAEQAVKPFIGGMNDDFTGLISEADPDQLLDAVVSKMRSAGRQNMDAGVSYSTSVANIDTLSFHSGSHPYDSRSSSGQVFCNLRGVSPISVKAEAPSASFVHSSSRMDKAEGCSNRQQGYKSQIRLWVENTQNVASDSLSAGQSSDALSAGQCKRIDETSKSNRKRARPGENPRPRPKDRQMIQDRIKELREIVPNTAKCSIDALLEKTIKHMLFLQSVAKHADRLKESGEPKIISQEGGLLLKDNFEGGATWAFEVGSQSMTCPIIVEDLNPPRQMLVEMLCKERGIFLEIADQIRGLGLTILKGVMEVRKDKIWARFAVEANKDITRMEIFLSLVHLLEPSTGRSMLAAGVENVSLPRNNFHPSSIPATGFSNCL